MPIARNMGYTPVSIPDTDKNISKALAAGIIEALKEQKINLDNNSLKVIEKRMKSQLTPQEPMKIARIDHSQPVKKASAAKTTPTKPGEVTLINVSNRDAAMIMAIVCDKLKCNPSQIAFKSIKAL